LTSAEILPATGGGAGRIGVIDIGSNSVRLVVFDSLSRSATSLFNEKVLCGLGRSLDRTGRLDPDGVKRAHATIRRFVSLAEAMKLERVDLIATAAVRDAEDGEEFVTRVRTDFGAEVCVLSGIEEARLVGLSVVAAMPDADGLVGDLGGGSLELVEVCSGEILNHTTLPLGTLRVFRSGAASSTKLAQLVDDELATVGWLGNLRKRSFYPIGGAWRSLARLDIAQRGYPLHVVDQYTISRREAETVTGVIEALSPKSLRRVTAISTSRQETLPTAAMIMRRLVLAANPSQLVFCSSGIREGHVYDLLPTGMKMLDPIISGCREIGRSANRFGEIGDELFLWTHPLFPDEDESSSRYRHAACLLADWAWREHPDSRAEAALHRALQLSVPGINHRDRCMIALALFHRYGAPLGDGPGIPKAILDEDDVDRAQRLGLALRLAMSLSGGAPGVVGRSTLWVGHRRLSLAYNVAIEQLMGDLVRRRLKALGQQMKLESRLVPPRAQR
jgi:exopolyphosphatase/guanosine-5'-triphosphate,3'-diphosphate pyrophosphatase